MQRHRFSSHDHVVITGRASPYESGDTHMRRDEQSTIGSPAELTKASLSQR